MSVRVSGLWLGIAAATAAAMGCGDSGKVKESSASGGEGGGGRSALVAKIDAIVNAPITDGKIAGASIAVIKGRDTIAIKAYGKADLELDVPTPPHATYEIGSVTKQFTAASILLLQEQGKLSLDDDITKYFPKFPTHGNKVTVRHLLNHTSGIKGYTEMPSFRLIGLQTLPQDTLIALVAREPFDFKTGDEEIYNNSAFFMAGKIIEKVSGMSYADFVEKNLFAKAGMKDSYYCSEKTIHKNHAHGYDSDSTGLVIKGFLVQLWPYAAGSLCSSAADLAAWNQALHGGKILSPDSYKAMTTRSKLNDGSEIGYGLGIALVDIDGRRAIHHGGGINGFLSESEYYPDDSLIVVVLQNSAGPVGPSDLTHKIAEAVLGKGPDKSKAFTGSLADYAGTYKGTGRGRASEITIEPAGNVLTSKSARGPKPDTLTFVGDDTFASGGMLMRFDRSGGKITGMRLDGGYGYNKLKKQ
ncbi:MAG: serine hydrolase domain-containing protein [Gemmatimonadota bacterium]